LNADGPEKKPGDFFIAKGDATLYCLTQRGNRVEHIFFTDYEETGEEGGTPAHIPPARPKLAVRVASPYQIEILHHNQVEYFQDSRNP